MPRILFLAIITTIFFSCSKNEDTQIEAVACFNIVRDTINYNETIAIEDCSINAMEYSYTLDGNAITLEELLSMKQESGNRRVSLAITSETGNKQYASQNFYVKPKHESFHLPTELSSKYQLLAFGLNPERGSMYAVFRDYLNNRFYYADISDDLKMSLTEIVSRSQNTGFQRAICNFEDDGRVYIDIPYVTASSIQRSLFWVNPDTGESEDPISLVSYEFDAKYINYNDQKYSVGANLEFSNGPKKYFPSINHYNFGSSTILKEFDFDDKSGIIHNFIPYKNGVLAYASSFDLLWGPDDYGIKDGKTILLELDTDFNVIKSHELPILGESDFTSVAALNKPFHMMDLPNNRVLLYGFGSFRILDADLNIIHGESLSAWATQSVFLLDDSIILSQNNHIKKFDFDGNLLAEFEYGQRSVAGILPYKGNYIFMSEVENWSTGEPEGGTLFFGVLDEDLNLILSDQ